MNEQFQWDEVSAAIAVNLAATDSELEQEIAKLCPFAQRTQGIEGCYCIVENAPCECGG